MRYRALVVLGATLQSVQVFAQAPAAAPAPQASPSPAAAMTDAMKESLKDVLEPPSGQYTYLVKGRRDPFISLLVNVGPSEAPKTRPTGMPGFLIQEIALKGIVKDESGFIAMLAATDGKSYFAKKGQRFYDGVIVDMDMATVTFRQDVTDPLSPVKTRDVKKSLYSSEEARQ